MALPEKFVERLTADLGEVEARALCEALEGEQPVSVRLNRCKMEATGVEDADLEKLDVLRPIGWSKEGRYLKLRPQFTFDTDFHAGLYYVQEASSQFVGHLLAKEQVRGKRILDLCAAPGGKSTLYSSLVGREGLVVANEIDRKRARVLVDNVKKWGLGNVVVTSCRPEQIGEWEGWFDVVAVDAPCSGEGMFRKDEVAREEWSENNVKICAARQDDILKEAWRALRPGGTLIYSTCTFNSDEDEGSLERMLAWAEDEVTESETIQINEEWGLVAGRVGAFQTFHCYPHRVEGEGFFAAVARKSFDVDCRQRLPKASRSVVAGADKKAVQELARWVKNPDEMQFMAVGDVYYGWYKSVADEVKALSERLPVIYSGVAMGQLFKGKLKPDGGLAFFADLNREVVPVAELDEEQALRYLRRQDVVATPFEDGMNLVVKGGHALGFAKRIGQRVNNLYPESLRIVKQ